MTNAAAPVEVRAHLSRPPPGSRRASPGDLRQLELARPARASCEQVLGPSSGKCGTGDRLLARPRSSMTCTRSSPMSSTSGRPIGPRTLGQLPAASRPEHQFSARPVPVSAEVRFELPCTRLICSRGRSVVEKVELWRGGCGARRGAPGPCRLDLCREPPQAAFVLIGGTPTVSWSLTRAPGTSSGGPPPRCHGARVFWSESASRGSVRGLRHPTSRRRTPLARPPSFDVAVDLAPPAQVEVADGEVGAAETASVSSSAGAGTWRCYRRSGIV